MSALSAMLSVLTRSGPQNYGQVGEWENGKMGNWENEENEETRSDCSGVASTSTLKSLKLAGTMVAVVGGRW